MLGYEGAWGSVFMAVLGMPLAWLLPGSDVGAPPAPADALGTCLPCRCAAACRMAFDVDMACTPAYAHLFSRNAVPMPLLGTFAMLLSSVHLL